MAWCLVEHRDNFTSYMRGALMPMWGVTETGEAEKQGTDAVCYQEQHLDP